MDDQYADLRNATAAALLRSQGTTTTELREAVAKGNPPSDLSALVQKIRTRAYTVTDGDIEALKQRYSEDQLFEIIVSAAFGAAHDRLAVTLRALEGA